MQANAYSEKSAGGVSLIAQSVPPKGFVLDCGEPEGIHTLRANLQRTFLESSYLPLRLLVVEVKASHVVLRGCVPNFYLKQLAQSVARKILGECSFVNLVTVTTPTIPDLTSNRVTCLSTFVEVCHENP